MEKPKHIFLFQYTSFNCVTSGASSSHMEDKAEINNGT